MNELITIQNNNIVNNSEISYLYFDLGDNKYAIKIKNVVEILKLPQLEYPQKLHNNIVGLLNYNNFTINVIDLRFYLNIEVTPYSTSTHVLIAKTDEMIFGIIIDKPNEIFFLDKNISSNTSFVEENNIIESIYKKDSDMISVINLNFVEARIKSNLSQNDFDVLSLFPKDEKSKELLAKRKELILKKNNSNIATNIFSQEKYIVFSLNKNFYCINIDYTKEFVKNVNITSIPCNLSYIEGVICLRGDFYTIVNLSDFIGEDLSINKTKNNIIIIDFADYKVGIAVDEILGIEEISEESIISKKDDNSPFISGEAMVTENLYSVVDIKNLLADERFFIEQE